MQRVSGGLGKHVGNATGRLHELGFRAVFEKQHCVRALLGELRTQPELAKFCPTFVVVEFGSPVAPMPSTQRPDVLLDMQECGNPEERAACTIIY